jgi:glycosyltransferase involved in cell wall biosynthesis
MTLESAGAWTVAHDFAFVYAGAERVTRLLAHEVLQGAPVVAIQGRESVLSTLSGSGSRFVYPRVLGMRNVQRALVPLYPATLGRIRPVDGHLLASSYAFAHHIPATGRRVVYCHSPLRQIWSGYDAYLSHMPFHQRVVAPRLFSYLRARDRAAARRADAYIAASAGVAARIDRFYGIQPAATIQPPVEGHFLQHPLEGKEDYFLWVGRITEPYKQLTPVVEAFADLSARLLIVGDGPTRQRLQARATPNVEFLGWQTGEQLGHHYRAARAVIFPSEDDFGIVPLEAMASGTPVLAFGSGGATQTVVEDLSGLFFHEQTPGAIREVLGRFERATWDPRVIRDHARQFGEDRFVQSVRDVLAGVL